MKNAALSFLSLLFLAVSWTAGPAGLPASQKKSADRKQESLADYFRQWLEKDVKYIITEDEKAVFQQLTADEEREQFVEQFWHRRDTDPTTPENEFKIEHYRRIQYANDVFAAGIPGWMTDRGRIYIKFGAPDRLQTYAGGSGYERPWQEGGGRTVTHPFERWEYRHIEGIGDDIEIEFVDYSGGNLYKISHNPIEKDMMLHVPWSGLTDAENDAEMAGMEWGDLRWRRIAGIREGGTGDKMGIYGERAKYTPFARLELAGNLEKPPVIRFTDLRAEVFARVSFNILSFNAYAYSLRLSGSYSLVPLTLQIPNAAVTYESQGDLRSSKLQVYGRVSGLTNDTVFEFDDEIVKQLTAAQYSAQKYSSSIYHRLMRLPAGRFKLDLLIKDATSSKVGTTSLGLNIPDFPDTEFSVSPVVLTSELIPLTEAELKEDPNAFGRFRIRPRVDETFHKGEYLGVYFEVYNAGLDPSLERPSVKVEYQLHSEGKAVAPFRDVSRSLLFDREILILPLYVDISAHSPGTYTVVFKVTDQTQDKSVETRTRFKIAG